MQDCLPVAGQGGQSSLTSTSRPLVHWSPWSMVKDNKQSRDDGITNKSTWAEAATLRQRCFGRGPTKE